MGGAMKGTEERPVRADGQRLSTSGGAHHRVCGVCDYIEWLGPGAAPGFVEAVAEAAARSTTRDDGSIGGADGKVDVSGGDGFMFFIEDVRWHEQFRSGWKARHGPATIPSGQTS